MAEPATQRTRGRAATRKHIPVRKCVACQRTQAKQDMIRVVRTQAGTIEIDPRGKLPGRGTYVCRTHECWHTGLEPRKLERVLKCGVSAEDVQVLRAAAALLLPEPISNPRSFEMEKMAGATKVDDALVTD